MCVCVCFWIFLWHVCAYDPRCHAPSTGPLRGHSVTLGLSGADFETREFEPRSLYQDRKEGSTWIEFPRIINPHLVSRHFLGGPPFWSRPHPDPTPSRFLRGSDRLPLTGMIFQVVSDNHHDRSTYHPVNLPPHKCGLIKAIWVSLNKALSSPYFWGGNHHGLLKCLWEGLILAGCWHWGTLRFLWSKEFWDELRVTIWFPSQVLKKKNMTSSGKKSLTLLFLNMVQVSSSKEISGLH